jgi:perosamine synthetase
MTTKIKESNPTETQIAKSTLPIFKPSYGEEEVMAVRECLEKGWTGCGPKVKEFEEKFAEYIGVKYAIATNSCTASLHLSLQCLEIKDREVISTPLTFVSTNHAILYNSGIPVFADVEADTLNIDPESIKKRITKKTKGIIAVHFGGHACNMDEILKIAIEHDLFVLEDVAHGCGGEYQGRKLGSLGMLGCFSFHAVKNLATGDGGMITTSDQAFYDRLIKTRWLGISRDTWSRTGKKYSWDYDVEEVGFKYHMNDITAAIGLVQLKKLEDLNGKRKQLAERYNDALKSISEIEIPVTHEYAKNAHHNYVIKTEKRDDLMQFLAQREISSGVHYRPNNHYAMYQNATGPTPVAEETWKKIVTLPLYPDLKHSEQDFIIQSIRSFFGSAD